MSDRNLGSDAEIQVGGVDDRARAAKIKEQHYAVHRVFDPKKDREHVCNWCERPWPCEVPWLVDALEKSWETIHGENGLHVIIERVEASATRWMEKEHAVRAERDAALAEVARLRDALGVIEGGVIEGDIASRWTEADPRHPVRALARAAFGGGSLAATPKTKGE